MQQIVYVSPDVDACQLTRAKLEKTLQIKFTQVNSLYDLLPYISDVDFVTDMIMFDLKKLCEVQGVNVFEIISTVSTLIRCNNRPESKKKILVAAADLTCDTDKLKTILRTDIDGVFPQGIEFSFEEKCQALEKLFAGERYIPSQIKEKLRSPNRARTVSSSNNLTVRQQQVMSLIVERGASNKTIARILNITESTVKLHTSAILKKYGVRNRTQLAVFNKNTEKT